MKHLFPLAALLSALGAVPLAAQPAIEAGMTPQQVRSAFGAPARTRDAGGWSYWFYSNGCPHRCGSDDVVFFQDGRVVAAVLRTGGRRFEGPRASQALEGLEPTPPSDTRPSTAPAGTLVVVPGENGTARVEGVRVTGPGQPAGGQGRSVIRPGTPGEEPGVTIVRTEPAGTTPGLNPRGSRAVRGTTARSQPLVDTAMDQSQIRRERAVTARTIPAGKPSAARADTSMDQTRIRRERQVTARTIPPSTPPAQPAGTPPAPGDTTGGRTSMPAPATPPRR